MLIVKTTYPFTKHRKGVSTLSKVELQSNEQMISYIKKSYLYSWADLKQLLKIGIINSNTMTAFAGFWLALYFTSTSFYANWHMLLVCVFGTAFIIAGGCVLNNYYDRDIDKVMNRTKKRPTVTGTMKLGDILLIGISLTIVGLSILLLASPQTAIIGFVGWFSYVVLYTMWTKRKYTINTAVGSLSGAIPPLIGWSCIDPNLHPVAWLLFLLIFIWQTPHFLAIAMKKVNEYKIANIPMLPVVYGFKMTKRQMLVYIICLLPIPFFMNDLGTVFVVIASILNVVWLMLALKGFKVGNNDKKWANQMFLYSLLYLTVIFILMITISFPTALF